jgi:diacylglycerol kinase (ATP)
MDLEFHANDEGSGRRLLVIFNPAAGLRRRARLQEVLDRLEGYGCPVTVQETEAAGHAERLARDADPTRYDVVVAAGGDGTINEVVNGLANVPMPLAIAPLGTANVLAAEMGLATDPDNVAATLARGAPRPVALASANNRRFIVMAGIGFDAEVVDEVSVSLKRWLGKGAYLAAFLHQLVAFRFPSYRVRIDGAEWQAASVIVANGRFYAGRFVLAPDADLCRPHLEVCLFGRRGRLSAIGYGLALITGRLSRLESFRIVPAATRVEIAGPPGAPVQGDGDIIARLDVVIDVLPGALNLVFPLGAGADAAVVRSIVMPPDAQAAGLPRQCVSTSTPPLARVCARTGTSQLWPAGPVASGSRRLRPVASARTGPVPASCSNHSRTMACARPACPG